jgi:hypothetical protein
MNIITFSDLKKLARLGIEMRGYLRHPVTLEQSKETLRRRLRNREANFLDCVKKTLYDNPVSPYLGLLKAAACEYGDLERIVNQDGVESALRQLMDKGVYVSLEEFKGKKDAVRGSSRFHFTPDDFDNPLLTGYYRVRSSGSRSAGTRVQFDFGNKADRVYYRSVMLAANNAMDVPMGIWMPMLPSSSGIDPLLGQWKIRRPLVKWFSPVTEDQVKASLRDRIASKFIVYGGRLCGATLPRPQYVSLSEAFKVAEWMSATKKRSGGCALSSFVSSAVKVCQAATENNIDVSGAHFFVAGEPLTEAKRIYIEAAGAKAISRYYISEVDFIGSGCLEKGGDDIHLFHDSVAVIQRHRKVEKQDIWVDAFLFTNLLASAPKILLNAEFDDYGVLKTESCVCLFGQMGFNQHLSQIRSFTKLTGVGMTIIGSDFLQILEEVLPQQFGGSATDYQLIEEEDDNGQTRLSLIISPTVGIVDEKKVIQTVLAELCKTGKAGKLASGLWSEANTLRIKRIPPLTASGKVAPLELRKITSWEKDEKHTC